jgi:F-type H+-transporting ATPase subunit a
MPKLGLKGKLIIIFVVIIGLIIISGIFFPVPKPEPELSPNYGGSQPAPFATLGPIYITNTFITAWITILTLVIFFFFATRKLKLIPKGIQNFAETVIEVLLNFVEGVAGKENGRRFFPIVASIFLFVLMNAWIALLPVFNVIGRGGPTTEVSNNLLHAFVPSLFPNYQGFVVTVPILRSANTDINVPLMLALVSFLCVEYWGATSLGVRTYLGKFFRFGQLLQGLGQLVKGKVKSAITTILYGAIDAFVGGLELLSEFVRIISFTFRLFGNMIGGEVLVLTVPFLIPWVVASVVYGLETFLGLIQAVIFAVLTLVFAVMAVSKPESEHEH